MITFKKHVIYLKSCEATMENRFYINMGNQQVSYKQRIEELVNQRFNTSVNPDNFYFVMPYTNQALALLSGIEENYFNKNFLCAAVLSRCLLDCMMSLIYVTQVSESDHKDFVDEFLKTGELTKLNAKMNKRIRVTGNDLAEVFKNCIKIDVSNSYKQLSKMVHPTIHHFHASTKSTSDLDYDCCISITCGEKTEYPQHLYDELKDIIDLCMNHIVLVWESL